MKNVGAKKVVIALCVAAAMLAIGSTWGRHASGQDGLTNNQSGLTNDQDEVRDALRRGGLREAARVKGHYVGEFNPHWDFGRFDVEALAKNSAAVIVGVASKKLDGRLSPSGQAILTDYEIKVSEAFKGSVTAGSSVKVALPGGLVEFEDGTSAELKTPEFESLKLGATYVMFLSESGDAPAGYVLSGGPQGLVEIGNDGKLKSHGRPTDPVSEESNDKDKDAFLKDVRSKSEKWPLPGKCCH